MESCLEYLDCCILCGISIWLFNNRNHSTNAGFFEGKDAWYKKAIVVNQTALTGDDGGGDADDDNVDNI